MRIIQGADDAAKLLSAASGHTIEPLIQLALATGMRRGELCALRWCDIDLDRAVAGVNRSVEVTSEGLRVKTPKTKRGRRSIVLPGGMVEVLRAHKKPQAEAMLASGARCPDGLVFCNPLTGEMLTPNAVTKAFQFIARKAGLPITLHGLRHSHATLLLSSGVHPKVAQERLGHSTVNVTLDTYSQVVEGLQEAAAAIIDGPLRAAMAKAKGRTGPGA